MKGYDSWLWRLFYWSMGYRWYWIGDPSRPLLSYHDLFDGDCLRGEQGIWRRIGCTAVGGVGHFDLQLVGTRHRETLGDAGLRDGSAYPVRRILMRKRLHDFLCCEGWAADLDAYYRLPACRAVEGGTARFSPLDRAMFHAAFALLIAVLPFVVLALVTS